MAKRRATFRFQRNDSVGAPAAEDDDFLQECFLDTGDLDLLSQCGDRRVILLGRTGTGKSALLRRLAEKFDNQVIRISPESLALTYVANSNVLKFFTELGINLDPFYKLLWRHVFTVEILTRFFDESVVGDSSSLIDRIRQFFAGPRREEKQMRLAIQYLEEWGKEFWNETEYRVKEITSTIEQELEASTSGSIGNEQWAQLKAGGSTRINLEEEQKAEVIRRGQAVVAKAQVRDLHQVFDLLNKVLSDRQREYIIIIDGLDENWVEEKLRYKLIQGVILTAREFIGVSHAKVIVALRRDLMERVFRLTRDSGFQEEKYDGLTLPLTWSSADIVELLDRRVQALVRRRYTRQPVSYRDVLPKKYRESSIKDVIGQLCTTPRDVVTFFNCCIKTAVDKSRIGSSELGNAIAEYSRRRLRALGDEWFTDYPHLLDFTAILRERSASFKVGTIADSEIEELCLDVVAKNPSGHGRLVDIARTVVDEVCAPTDFFRTMLQAFYQIGLVGLKTSPDTTSSWSDDSSHAVTRGQIDDATSIIIAAKYRRALGSRE